uniref:Chemosensory protein 23 n=1 Tax=Oedaleus infernalis TaxID=267432 RepID=A0A3G2LGG3_9ORTH|nr:chemosensory protein 23 [Oedaleus infernalis]
MRACRGLLLLAAYAAAVVTADASMRGKTLVEFANTDWAAYLGDRPAIERHIKCVLDKMPCDESGLKLKSLLPFMMDQNCRKCSNIEKLFTRKLKRMMAKHYPEAYRDMALLARHLQREAAAAAITTTTPITTTVADIDGDTTTVSSSTALSCVCRCRSLYRRRHRHRTATASGRSRQQRDLAFSQPSTAPLR